jgi:DNA-binding transcriptional LysR family regulator
MCSDVSPPAAVEVSWTRVCTDPMFVLIDEHHPYAGKPEVSLAELAEEQWLCVPSHGCLEECFVSACVRAGFAPRGMGEAEWTTAVDQVRAGRAVALVEPGQLDPPGVVTVPLAGAPLRRTHYLGWRHDADLRVDLEAVEGAAHRAHRDAVRRSPQYEQWLEMYGVLG